MKRAALALLVVPLVALWLYGCDKAENPLETQSQVSETPLFAPGGGKVKAEPNPIGCQKYEVAKWYDGSGPEGGQAEWRCAPDLQGAGGGGPTTHFVYGEAGTGVFNASTGVSVIPYNSSWIVSFPVDVEVCAIVLLSEETLASENYIIRSPRTDPKEVQVSGQNTFSLIVAC